MREWLTVLKEGPAHIRYFMKLAKTVASPSEKRRLLDAAVATRKRIRQTLGEIRRYLVIPLDAAPSCPCGSTDHHRLPEWLAAQIQTLS